MATSLLFFAGGITKPNRTSRTSESIYSQSNCTLSPTKTSLSLGVVMKSLEELLPAINTFGQKLKSLKNYFPIPRVWVKNLVLDLPNKLANKRHTALDVAKTIEHILKRTTPLRKIDCINFTITQRSFWFSPISQLWQEKLWMVRKIQIENEWLSRSMKRQVSKHTTVFSSNKKHIRILSGYVCLSNKWIRGCLFIAWVTWQEIVRQR